MKESLFEVNKRMRSCASDCALVGLQKLRASKQGSA